MKVKEFAHAAQQHLKLVTGVSVKRMHVYELIAASFGFGSHAAFQSSALLCDAGVGMFVPNAGPGLIGRGAQFGYTKTEATALAETLVSFSAELDVSYVKWDDILTMATLSADLDDESAYTDDLESGLDDDQPNAGGQEWAQLAELQRSSMLMDGLEREAADGEARAHFALAAVNRCGLPDAYLHEESLKGRILNSVEQAWADEYVRNKPRFEKYRYHLLQAGIGGVCPAALEYAEVFKDPQLLAIVAAGANSVDPERMAKVVDMLGDPEEESQWLYVAAEQGSSSAIEQLAQRGDFQALRTLAVSGNSNAVRYLAEIESEINNGSFEALKAQAGSGNLDAIRHLAEIASKTNLLEAWMWQYFAELLGVDLTESSMRAYHDGGLYDGQEYDDDHGGALYVDGDEGLHMNPLDVHQDAEARERARKLFERMRDQL